MGESDFAKGLENNTFYGRLCKAAAAEGAAVMPISAKLEEEISALPPEEKALFLADIGLERSGLDRLIACCYQLLGLISFLTAGEPEVRAWDHPSRHQGAGGGRENPHRHRTGLYPG